MVLVVVGVTDVEYKLEFGTSVVVGKLWLVEAGMTFKVVIGVVVWVEVVIGVAPIDVGMVVTGGAVRLVDTGVGRSKLLEVRVGTVVVMGYGVVF